VCIGEEQGGVGTLWMGFGTRYEGVEGVFFNHEWKWENLAGDCILILRVIGYTEGRSCGELLLGICQLETYRTVVFQRSSFYGLDAAILLGYSWRLFVVLQKSMYERQEMFFFEHSLALFCYWIGERW
jgi:hypothetical protein